LLGLELSIEVGLLDRLLLGAILGSVLGDNDGLLLELLFGPNGGSSIVGDADTLGVEVGTLEAVIVGLLLGLELSIEVGLLDG
jgi:hypothetical protein